MSAPKEAAITHRDGGGEDVTVRVDLTFRLSGDTDHALKEGLASLYVDTVGFNVDDGIYGVQLVGVDPVVNGSTGGES